MKQEVASAEYKVVVNIEGQYSIWRVHRSNPDGWKDGGFFGPKDDCLNFIKAKWVNLTPRSVTNS